VRQPGAHDVIGDRALGTDPMQVAALGSAVLDGLAQAGVVGCVKHMPGHGRAMADSHKELPTVTASEDELAIDVEPFRTLASAPIGMTSHVLYTAWDAENPATLSSFVIGEVIRKRIGFGGLLLSDDIDMQALSGTIPERAERAVAAGCDIVLNCWAKMDDMVGIAERIPAASEATLSRLEQALSRVKEPQDGTERADLIAKRDSLLDLARARA
jgi:beta-N-acetylhexosaminidase